MRDLPHSRERISKCLRSLSAASALVIVLVPCLAAEQSTGKHHAFSILYVFQGQPDGGNPEAGVIQDSAGNIYGTTYSGGTGSCYDNYAYGCGTVFMVDAGGKETVLYSFAGYPSDGEFPASPLIRDSSGNLYGTTIDGGAFRSGTVFRVASTGTETVLYNFSGSSDGGSPSGGLIQDAAGNLYGTTTYGGTGNGVVFKLDATGHETVLHQFKGRPDGALPYAGLIQDAAGSLYGTTERGGSSKCGGAVGCGVVFKLDSSGTETILHTFTDTPDGAYPRGRLLLDAKGRLYGTTGNGGEQHHPECRNYGCGTVFKLGRSGKETILHRFGGDGAYPDGALILDAAGNLYGSTAGWGDSGCNCGLVFELNAKGNDIILHYFVSSRRGAYVQQDLWSDASGNLYGTTLRGGGDANCGGYGCGIVFKVTP
jgi:uncharacterized repeat protein (TIGR03803 family)